MKKILLAGVAVVALALSFGAPAMADSFSHIRQSAVNKGTVTNIGTNSSGTLSGNFTVQANSASGASDSISKTTNNASSSGPNACGCASIDVNARQSAYNSGAVSNVGTNTTGGGALSGVASAQVNAATGASNSVASFVNVH